VTRDALASSSLEGTLDLHERVGHAAGTLHAIDDRRSRDTPSCIFGGERRPMTFPKRTPPEGLPRRIRDRPALRLDQHPISAHTLRRLDRHIDWAVTQRAGWKDHLRVTVKVAIAEMQLAGIPADEIGALLTQAIVEHPSSSFYETASLITRERRSTTLTKLVLGWLAGYSAEREDARPKKTRKK
jgi:hypothetical protein